MHGYTLGTLVLEGVLLPTDRPTDRRRHRALATQRVAKQALLYMRGSGLLSSQKYNESPPGRKFCINMCIYLIYENVCMYVLLYKYVYIPS